MIVPGPSNDDIENAVRIGGDTTLSTAGATFQPGEPSFGYAEGRSVWYIVVPRTSGQLSIDTGGSTFDTTLAVFALRDSAAGARVNNLRVLAENDDALAQQSRVTLDVVAGQPYYVRLAGFGAQGGDAELNFSGVQLAPSGTAPGGSGGGTGGAIALSISGSSVLEGDSGLTPGAFTVTRGGDITTTLDVSYTFGGTAQPSDYAVQATVGVIRFAPG